MTIHEFVNVEFRWFFIAILDLMNACICCIFDCSIVRILANYFAFTRNNTHELKDCVHFLKFPVETTIATNICVAYLFPIVILISTFLNIFVVLRTVKAFVNQSRIRRLLSVKLQRDIHQLFRTGL